jgi:hypothetical protein
MRLRSSGTKLTTVNHDGYLKSEKLIWLRDVRRPAVDGHLEARDGGVALGADWGASAKRPM